jgi:hypothetical protein
VSTPTTIGIHIHDDDTIEKTFRTDTGKAVISIKSNVDIDLGVAVRAQAQKDPIP